MKGRTYTKILQRLVFDREAMTIPAWHVAVARLVVIAVVDWEIKRTERGVQERRGID
jgi:hypothetical protein